MVDFTKLHENQIYYLRKSKEKEYLSNKYKKYLLSPNQYYNLARIQNYKCAICNKPEISKTQKGNIRALSIDHDHNTGKVRSLLCSKCNTGLGMYNEDVNLFSKVIDYLILHKHFN